VPRAGGARFGASRSGGTRAHLGVDLAAPVGTPVRAVAGGTVERVERDEHSGRAGRYVRIAHPGDVVSRYVHLDEIRADLAPGDFVAAGESIGTVGRTGVKRSGAHLHFTLSHRPGGPGTPETYIDPAAWLDAWRRGVSLPPAGENVRSSPQVGAGADDNQIKGGPS
jgi:murein DD-endopeptidase MepM/ murein hydrolase activator NlpD